MNITIDTATNEVVLNDIPTAADLLDVIETLKKVDPDNWQSFKVSFKTITISYPKDDKDTNYPWRMNPNPWIVPTYPSYPDSTPWCNDKSGTPWDPIIGKISYTLNHSAKC